MSIYECNFNQSKNYSYQQKSNYFIKLFLHAIVGIFVYLCLSLYSAAYAEDTVDQIATQSSALSSLVKVLEDPDTRQKLIDELNKISLDQDPNNDIEVDANTQGLNGDNTSTTATDSNQSDGGAITQTIVQEGDSLLLLNPITNKLQNFATNLRTDISNSTWIISRLITGKYVPGISFEKWTPALHALIIVLIAVIIAHLTLGLVAKRITNTLNNWIARHQKSKITATTGIFVIDVFSAILASMAGYATVIAFSENEANASVFAIQFLSAFLFVEILIAISRAIFSVRHPNLRLLPINTQTATYWHRWLGAIIYLTVYSLVLIIPLTQALITTSVAQVTGLLIMSIVYIYAVQVVWRHRNTVSSGLIGIAENMQAAVIGSLIRVIARLWHWLAIVYFTILLVISQIDEKGAIQFMMYATIQTLISIIVAVVLISWISNLLTNPNKKIKLLSFSSPALNARIKTYSITALRVIRVLVASIATLLILDAWHAFDMTLWFNSPVGKKVLSTMFSVSVILIIAALSWTVLASTIEHRISNHQIGHKPSEREKTLLLLFKNAAAITIVTITILIVLSHLGIDIGPLLAGAGVAGLAIGFGAQKLVQDVITGIFIQLENGMNQNDTVEVAGLFGTVEKITIRSVVIRTMDGGYHLIPFSAIDKVSNHTRGYGYHVTEYLIAHKENVDATIEQIKTAFASLKENHAIAPEILEDISIPGVTSLSERGFTIRVMIKTTPGNQWMVQRAFNKALKEQFDQSGIEIPYPQTVVHFANDANIAVDNKANEPVET